MHGRAPRYTGSKDEMSQELSTFLSVTRTALLMKLASGRSRSGGGLVDEHQDDCRVGMEFRHGGLHHRRRVFTDFCLAAGVTICSVNCE